MLRPGHENVNQSISLPGKETDHKEGVDVEARGHEDVHQSIYLPGEETDHKEGVDVEARGHEDVHQSTFVSTQLKAAYNFILTHRSLPG
jgi:hypothetical protein